VIIIAGTVMGGAGDKAILPQLVDGPSRSDTIDHSRTRRTPEKPRGGGSASPPPDPNRPSGGQPKPPTPGRQVPNPGEGSRGPGPRTGGGAGGRSTGSGGALSALLSVAIGLGALAEGVRITARERLRLQSHVSLLDQDVHEMTFDEVSGVDRQWENAGE